MAGLGGFSGRESSVSSPWIAMQVRNGRLRWVIDDDRQDFRARGDTRSGSQRAMAVVTRSCPAVTASRSTTGAVKLYDCQGHAAAILAAAKS